MRSIPLRPLLFLLVLVFVLSSMPSVLANPHSSDSTQGVSAMPNDSTLVSSIYALDLANEDFDRLTTTDPTAIRITPFIGGPYIGGDFANNDFSFLYVVFSGQRRLDRLSTATGGGTVIGYLETPDGYGRWQDLSFDPTTNMMYALFYDSKGTGTSLYTVDLTDATTTLLASNNVLGPNIIDGAIHPTTGFYYGVDITSDTLVIIDKSTAALTVVGPLGFDASFDQGMDFEDSTGTLYWAAYQGPSTTAQLRTIDLATGASTLIGDITNNVPGERVRLDAFAVASSATGPTPTIPPTSIELRSMASGGDRSYAGWLLGHAGLALIAAGIIARRQR